MNNDNFLARQNNDRQVLLNEEYMSVEELLDEKYDYIKTAMQDEGFMLKNPYCNLFKEITCKNKVVGFCSYIFDDEYFIVALNNIYILPEFRGNRLFLKELTESMNDYKLGIAEPTRFVMELLVHYGFAQRVNDKYILSALELVIPSYNLLSSDNTPVNRRIVSHHYDINLCATFSIIDHEQSLVHYSQPLNDDIVRYDCLDYRSKIDEYYFIDLNKEFLENGEFVDIIKNLEDKLSLKKYSLDDVVGYGSELSPYLHSLIDDGHTTLADALKVKEQLTNEYNNGMVLDEALLTRLAYLFEEDDSKIKEDGEETCPYCLKTVDHHDKFCHTCGYTLTHD